jgi:hypothetical protein
MPESHPNKLTILDTFEVLKQFPSTLSSLPQTMRPDVILESIGFVIIFHLKNSKSKWESIPGHLLDYVDGLIASMEYGGNKEREEVGFSSFFFMTKVNGDRGELAASSAREQAVASDIDIIRNMFLDAKVVGKRTEAKTKIWTNNILNRAFESYIQQKSVKDANPYAVMIKTEKGFERSIGCELSYSQLDVKLSLEATRGERFVNEELLLKMDDATAEAVADWKDETFGFGSEPRSGHRQIESFVLEEVIKSLKADVNTHVSTVTVFGCAVAKKRYREERQDE